MNMQVIATEAETFSGRFVDLYDPDPSTIDLEDIAHALANTGRFGGHCKRFYSVAEHAVFVSRRVEQKGGTREQQLIALHHDDAEAFLCDIPRPLKPLLGEEYAELTRRMDAAIQSALGLPWCDDPLDEEIVKDADNFALFVEARTLLPSEGRHWQIQPKHRIIVPDYYHGGLAPKAAELIYLLRHDDLTS